MDLEISLSDETQSLNNPVLFKKKRQDIPAGMPPHQPSPFIMVHHVFTDGAGLRPAVLKKGSRGLIWPKKMGDISDDMYTADRH
jgi:hypothetical protein